MIIVLKCHIAYIVRDKYDSWSVDEIGVSVKSIPRHENQRTAAMWWTVDHVASDQQSVESRVGGGNGCLHGAYICIVLLLLFCFPCDVHLYLYLSSSALVFCTS